jgi:hypothetical protein
VIEPDIFSLWFAAYQQEKPLVQHIRLMNAARKEAIEYSSAFLTTPVRPEPVEPKHFSYFIPKNADEAYGSRGPIHGDLQTADTRAFHEHRKSGLAGRKLESGRGLPSERAACGCPHVRQGYSG